MKLYHQRISFAPSRFSLFARARSAVCSPLFGLLGLLNAVALANTAVTITVDPSVPGQAIASTFLGSSFGVQQLTSGNNPSYYGFQYTPANTNLIHLYNQMGIHHFRLSYDAFDSTNNPEPTAQQIDDFFDFCKDAGITKVVWSFPLRFDQSEGSWDYKAVAHHIWTTTTANGANEQAMLEAFAFDNEPDINNKWPGSTLTQQYNAYLSAWKAAANNIKGQTASNCPFAGPDCLGVGSYNGHGVNNDVGPNNQPWDVQFAQDITSPTYNIVQVNQHCYIGGPGHPNSTDGGGIGDSSTNYAQPWNEYGWANFVLQNNWSDQPGGLISNIDSTVHAPLSVAFRYTESEFFADQNPINHIFGASLAYLDFLRLAARHNVVGVDAMDAVKSDNSPVYVDNISTDTYTAEPMAYAQKAFWMGSYGGNVIYSDRVTFNNTYPGLTAYGVVNGHHLYVTVINKTCASAYGASDFNATMHLKGFPATTVSVSILEEGVNVSDDAGGYGVDISGGTLTTSGSFTPNSQRHSVSGDYTEVVQAATAKIFDFSY